MSFGSRWLSKETFLCSFDATHSYRAAKEKKEKKEGEGEEEGVG